MWAGVLDMAGACIKGVLALILTSISGNDVKGAIHQALAKDFYRKEDELGCFELV